MTDAAASRFDLVDHRRGVKHDNRIGQIRPSSATENQQNLLGAQRNNKAGYLGVSPHGSGWRAQIMANGVHVPLGTFATPQEASTAYQRAKRELHPGATL